MNSIFRYLRETFHMQRGKLGKMLPALVLILVSVMIIGVYSYKIFTDKAYDNLQKNFIPIFEQYLSNRYPDEMKVEQVYYNSQSDEYSCYAYSSNNKIDFYVFAEKNGNSGESIFRDNYLAAFWEKEIENELSNQLAEIYPNLLLIDVKIMGRPVQYANSTQYVFEFNDYTQRSKIPSFDEVKNNAYINEIYKTIEIYINDQWVQDNKDEEYKKIISVLQHIRGKEYNPTYLTIQYGSGNKSIENMSFDSKVGFTFYKKDINGINTIDELKSKIEK